MLTEFDPVRLSIQENKWLVKHAGEPWVVAGQDIHPVYNERAVKGANGQVKDSNPYIYPDGVVPASVKPLIDGIYEHVELEKHGDHQWVGLEAIKQAASTYIEQAEQWERSAKNPRTGTMKAGAVRFPSMYGWDARNRPHWRATGSDSDQVRTYIDKNRERIPFKLSLVAKEAAWTPDFAKTAVPIALWALTNNEELNRLECPCGATETYKAASRASFNAARARMSKHLRRAQDNVEEHRELHTLEFES